MALRNKKIKIMLSTLAIAGIIISSNSNITYAYNELSKESISTQRNIENKSYKVSNKTTAMKEDGSVSTSEHGQQTVRNCIANETLIEEVDGKIYATYEFTESLYSMFSNIRISVDGVEASYNKNDDRKYRVELNSIDSEVLIIVKAGPHDTYMKIDLEQPGKEEVKSYTISNKTTALKEDGSVSTSEHGQQTVRNALSESTLIEEVNGKIYATYEFTEALYSMISDIRISVDGVETSYEKTDDRMYKVELNSIDSEVVITVKAGPHDTYIKVTLGNDDTGSNGSNEDSEIVPPTDEDDSANGSELEDNVEADKDESGDKDIDIETDKEDSSEEDTEASKDNNSSDKKLPQTGSVLGSTALFGTGGLLMSLAAFMKKRNN